MDCLSVPAFPNLAGCICIYIQGKASHLKSELLCLAQLQRKMGSVVFAFIHGHCSPTPLGSPPPPLPSLY